MPAEKQVDAVVNKLMELNPGYDGKVTGVHYSHVQDREWRGH